jgi:flagellar biosynthesis component FlhA
VSYNVRPKSILQTLTTEFSNCSNPNMKILKTFIYCGLLTFALFPLSLLLRLGLLMCFCVLFMSLPKEAVKEGAEAVKEKAKEAKDSATSVASEAKEKVKETAESVKDEL